MINSRAKLWQVLSAWLCLVATFLLFAPLIGAAWDGHAAACCAGDHCPVSEHHSSKAPAHGAACEHQTGGLTACTMDCCQNVEHLMLVALAFIVPDGTIVPKPDLTNFAEPATGAMNFLSSLEVLSPPPRVLTNT